MNATIRLASPADADRLQAIYAPVVRDTFISFETEVPGVEEMARRVAHTVQQYPWLVYQTDGALAGYVYASQHRTRAAYQWSVDVTAYIDPRYHRAGIGRALYTSLFRVLVLQGFYNAYAVIALPNPASVGLHQALGFEPVGVCRSAGYKQGAWHDVGWWQLVLQAPATPPLAPQPLPALLGAPELETALQAGLSPARPIR